MAQTSDLVGKAPEREPGAKPHLHHRPRNRLRAPGVRDWRFGRMADIYKSKKSLLPFPFILDQVISLRPTIKQMFGFTYVLS